MGGDRRLATLGRSPVSGQRAGENLLLLVGVPDNLKAPVEKLFPQPDEQPVAVHGAVGDPRRRRSRIRTRSFCAARFDRSQSCVILPYVPVPVHRGPEAFPDQLNGIADVGPGDRACDVELPVAAAARECGLDDAGREALYKAVGAGKVEARELKEGQQLPRRYVRLEAVREWAANVYKPR